MSINFTTKNVDFIQPLKDFTEKHLKSIEKLVGEIIDAEVIVNGEKITSKVEISVKTRLGSFYVEERNHGLKQALRGALNTLKVQAKKNKEKLKEERKRKRKGGFFRRSSEILVGEKGEKRGDLILVSDNFSRKPLNVEEAVFFLKESKDNAFMFINSETNQVAVVYFNRTGAISILEPNIK